MQQYTFTREANNLLCNSSFSDGMAYWFGDGVSHILFPNTKQKYGALIEDALVGNYTGLPPGMHQWIDCPAIETFAHSEYVNGLTLYPVSDTEAILSINDFTSVNGQPLYEGIDTLPGSAAYFQHPFVYQDADGLVPIELGSALTLYSGNLSYDVVVRTIFYDEALTPQSFAYHQVIVNGTFDPLIQKSDVFGTSITSTYNSSTKVSLITFTSLNINELVECVRVDGTSGLSVGDTFVLGTYIGTITTIGTVTDDKLTIACVPATTVGKQFSTDAVNSTHWSQPWKFYEKTGVATMRSLPVYSYVLTSAQNFTLEQVNSEDVGVTNPPTITLRKISDDDTIDGLGEVSVTLLNTQIKTVDDGTDGSVYAVHKYLSRYPLTGRWLYTNLGNQGDQQDTQQNQLLIKDVDIVGTDITVTYIKSATPGFSVNYIYCTDTEVVVDCPGMGSYIHVGDSVFLSGEIGSSHTYFAEVAPLIIGDKSYVVRSIDGGIGTTNTALHFLLSDFTEQPSSTGWTESNLGLDTPIRISFVNPKPRVYGTAALDVPGYAAISNKAITITSQTVTGTSFSGADIELVGTYATAPGDASFTTAPLNSVIYTAVPVLRRAAVTNVSLYKGDVLEDVSSDVLFADTVPTDAEVLPKGSVVLYAGGQLVPPGYKRVTLFDPTQPVFSLDPPDAIKTISGKTYMTWDTPIPAPGEPYLLQGYDSYKLLDVPGTGVSQAIPLRAYRLAYQPGMTIRIPDRPDVLDDRATTYFISDMSFDIVDNDRTLASATPAIDSRFPEEHSVYGAGVGNVTYPGINPAEYYHPNVPYQGLFTAATDADDIATYPNVAPAGPPHRRQLAVFAGGDGFVYLHVIAPVRSYGQALLSRLDCDSDFDPLIPRYGTSAQFIDGTDMSNAVEHSMETVAGAVSGDVFFFELYGRNDTVSGTPPFQTTSSSYQFIDSFLGIVEQDSSYGQWRWQVYRYDGKAIKLHGFNTVNFPSNTTDGSLPFDGLLRGRPAKLYGRPGSAQTLQSVAGVPDSAPLGTGTFQSTIQPMTGPKVWATRVLDPQVTIVVDGVITDTDNMLLEGSGYLAPGEESVMDYGQGPHSHAISVTSVPGNSGSTPLVRFSSLAPTHSLYNTALASIYDGPYTVPKQHDHGSLYPAFMTPLARAYSLCIKI